MLPTSHPHHVTVTNRYGNTMTAPVVYVKDLGGAQGSEVQADVLPS
jgi:hypothetical protein